jgi:hypothetical protein
MNVMVTGSQLKEFGIYEEGGVITLGFRFVHDLEIKSLILQMEESTSELGLTGTGSTRRSTTKAPTMQLRL